MDSAILFWWHHFVHHIQHLYKRSVEAMFERNSKVVHPPTPPPCVAFPAGNCQRRTPISTSLWRRRALKRRGWAATTRSFCGVSRPARSCPLRPPRCTVLFQPPPSPRPRCSPPPPLLAATPLLIATAARSRLSTSPPPTDPLPIKTFPRDQPLKGPRPIRITPLVRPHPHTEPVAVILHLVSAHYRDKHFLSSPLPAFFSNMHVHKRR